MTARYLRGDSVDEIAARWRPGEGTAWYLTDHLGTVREIVNGVGTIIQHLDYDSFGRILSQTNPAAGDRFAFTGREWDDAIELYFYRARFYDPTTGRFLSQDPIGFASGDTNLYRYVGNNPLDYVDPSGNLAITECGFVRFATSALNVACTTLQMALKGQFNLEGLSPEDRLAKSLENTFQMVNLASSVLPFGSAPALQLVMKSVTIVTTAQSLAGLLTSQHLFTIAETAAGYVTEAYYKAVQAYDDLSDLTFQDVMQHYGQIENKPLFWSQVACGAANMALMVWSAKARCFVAGTPVVVEILPPRPDDFEDVDAEIDSVFKVGHLDWLAGVAIAGAVMARRRQRKKHEDDRVRYERDLYFAGLGEDDDDR